MTNNQAQSYAIVALKNLIDAGLLVNVNESIYDKFDREMYYLMDRYSETEIEKIANRILEQGK